MQSFISAVLLSLFFSMLFCDVVLAGSQVKGKKIGLVLSGGGARGAAHIGVLKILEENNIPIDYITGTSMGAIVGGLYATGMTVNEIEQAIVGDDWQPLFLDRPPRADRPFRRKEDDNGFLVDFDMGVNKDGLVFPKGLVQGQNLEMILKRHILPVSAITDFDELPIPFRAIATDLGSGEALAIGSGDLATAIRASMSLPGVFKPVEYQDRLLVDGGVVNNLPVQIAREMGAEILIVVDIGFPLEEAKELDSALAVTRQMLTIMIVKRTHEQLEKLEANDILIQPELGSLDSREFHRLEEAMKLGEQKARESVQDLAVLSISEREYKAHRLNISQARRAPSLIQRVVIENESNLSPKVFEARLSPMTGKELNIAQLEKELADIYGFNTFESVKYHLEETPDGTELHVKGKEKSWGPNYLKFGMNLEDDFSGTSDYNLAARLTRTELNGLGGEMRIEGQLGESPSVFAEFYQPLDYAARWFINPSVKLGRSSSTLFSTGDRIAQFRNDETVFSLAAGRNIQNWGELRFSILKILGSTNLRIGDPRFPDSDSDASGFSAGFYIDTLDNLNIPKTGTLLSLEWLGIRENLGADIDTDVAFFSLVKPMTRGKHTLLHWWNVGGVVKSHGNDINGVSFGGLFGFSGYAPTEISGKYGAIGRMLYYYQLNDTNSSALDIPIYLGMSVEGGYLKNDSNSPQYNNLLMAGSAFVMLETILGPIYLAYGMAEHSNQSAYLFLGQTF